jgi:ankyrin repeat protein
MRRAVKAMTYLLNRGVDINFRDKNGMTALLTSCHWGNYEAA